MALSGEQVRRIHAAFLDAYNEASLRFMLRVELEANLRAVAGGENFSDVVFALIDWADRTGRMDDLIRGALSQNPGNPLLRQLVLGWGDAPRVSPDVPPTQTTAPGISAGTYIAGSVSTGGGDFIGRDKIIQGDEIHGDKVLGDKITIYIGDSATSRSVVVDRRALEIAYLDGVIAEQEKWARVYTPLEGIVETEQVAVNSPRLKTQTLLMNPEFEHLVKRSTGAVERVPVPDLRDAIREHRRLVILGEPGSGKTTTLRRLAYEYAEAAKHVDDAPLPVYVQLGGYRGSEDAPAYVATHFGDLAPYVREYLKQRRIVLLLDALNEMPRHDYAQRVGRIQSLLDSQADIGVVVTCRELDYIETLRLEKLNIKPLSVDQQRSYVQQYLGDEDGEQLFWQLAGGSDAAETWKAWQEAGGTWQEFWSTDETPKQVRDRIGWRLRQLWRELRRKPLPGLLELGANPYMLVMFAQVYADEGEVPQNRGMLFQRFVDTLLAREERRHDANAWPGSERICQGLAELAFAMQESGERGTAVDRAWAAKQIHALPPSDLFYLAASATLLDVSDGEVRFVHQLLQEYFAAWAWEQKWPSADLASYWPKGWATASGWEETAVLLSGILPDMTDFVRALYRANPPLAARCIADSGGERPNPDTCAAVQQTLVDVATSTNAPVNQRNLAGNALNYLGDRRPGVGVTDGVPDIVWCEVPAGEFLMGSDKKTDELANEDESPQHSVYLDRFFISRFPVTNAQYACFVAEGGYTERRRHCWTDDGWEWKTRQDVTNPERYGGVFELPNHPVVGVSWYEAVAFCNWLGEQLGRKVALPSEAQWEKAARGADGRRYPWDDELSIDHANYDDTGIRSTSAVGIFPKGESPCGVLDMAGNVWEWAADWYAQDYYAVSPERNPTGPDDGNGRTLRGGSWFFYARLVRCACRDRFNPFDGNDDYGFRVLSPGF